MSRIIKLLNWLRSPSELQRQKIITETALLAYELTKDKLREKEAELKQLGGNEEIE